MTRLDQNLSRASHIAQIVLVCVAVFGYFFTVRPIYQKELLAEDVAQKQVELQSLREQVKAARKEIAVRTARQFTIAAGAECTGLLEPPSELLKIGDPIPLPKPDLHRSFQSMTSCAQSIFSEFEPFNKLSQSEMAEVRRDFEAFCNSAEIRRAINEASDPEEKFRTLINDIQWLGGKADA
ncbi:hypothetical protein [Thalassolituus oleivorans]|uniref:hypothetical protein n=1 Tax=Thalassolituus oleivorans TaxID=187493 RepID=UPI0023F33094|nr:hypothetical protein [Thalassolituus oleivorans]